MDEDSIRDPHPSRPATQQAGKNPGMKATFDLPEDLLQEIKMRAVLQRRPAKELVAELLRNALFPKRAESLPAKQRSNARSM
jgi:hypothetical protein